MEIWFKNNVWVFRVHVLLLDVLFVEQGRKIELVPIYFHLWGSLNYTWCKDTFFPCFGFVLWRLCSSWLHELCLTWMQVPIYTTCILSSMLLSSSYPGPHLCLLYSFGLFMLLAGGGRANCNQQNFEVCCFSFLVHLCSQPPRVSACLPYLAKQVC